MFAGLSKQITDTYNKLIARGYRRRAGAALIGPTLQTLWELQQDFGYAVDEATQKLIDQGVEAGVVGDEHRSAQEQMLLAMDRTAAAVEYLAEQLGYVAEGATTAADEMATVPDKYLEAMKTATPEMKAEYEVWLAEAEGFASKAGDEAGAIPDKYLGALENATPEMQEQFQAWLAASENAFSGVEDAATVAADGVVDEFTNAAQRTREALAKIPDELKIKVNYDIERFEQPSGPTGGTGARPYAKGGVVYAQHGMWAPRGTDTVPAMLTPGEVVLPREVVAALRSSSGSGAVTVNLAISAIDGADVERVVRSPEFRRALTSAVSGQCRRGVARTSAPRSECGSAHHGRARDADARLHRHRDGRRRRYTADDLCDGDPSTPVRVERVAVGGARVHEWQHRRARRRQSQSRAAVHGRLLRTRDGHDAGRALQRHPDERARRFSSSPTTRRQHDGHGDGGGPVIIGDVIAGLFAEIRTLPPRANYPHQPFQILPERGISRPVLQQGRRLTGARRVGVSRRHDARRHAGRLRRLVGEQPTDGHRPVLRDRLAGDV